MSCCVIFGGAGFVGTHLAKHFLRTGRFSHIHIADIRPSCLEGTEGITVSSTDVRQRIPLGMVPSCPEWVFNLAAVHREPGHEPHEYYETNLAGATNVCEYATGVRCSNIYFTSSISVYGPTCGPTDESSPIRPVTPYGGSKYPAEVLHRSWLDGASERRLLISRPGVLYGPGDPGNILRMIQAIQKGYFAFPGSPDIYKSYGYIFGLLASIDFMMGRADRLVIYNYVETPTEPLSAVVASIKQFLHCRACVLPIPLAILLPVSKLAQAILGSSNPVHPVRVRKAATPTHILPGTLSEMGFRSPFSFLESLRHWSSVAPTDFGLESTTIEDARVLPEPGGFKQPPVVPTHDDLEFVQR